MFCPNCGKEISEETKFCSACGTRLADDTGAAGKNSTRQEKYVRPEKVRFSERWLLLKIGIFQFFVLGFVMWMFEDGIDEILYASSWITFISGIILLCLFTYFTVRAFKMYGGNPYMLKVPVQDQTLLNIVKGPHYATKVTEFLFTVSVVIRGLVNVRTYGFFSLYTWMEAVQHAEGWAVLSALICFAYWMAVSLRSIAWWNKNADFEGVWSDDEEEKGESEENVL